MAADARAVSLLLDVAAETDLQDGDQPFAEAVLRRGLELQRDDLPASATTIYLSLLLTDDAGIAAINHEHRGVAAPTDVLSFPQFDHLDDATPPAAGLPLMLGDIVVSMPRAAEQARRYGHSRTREFGFLLVHGLLHLLGYDHETAEEAAAMEARQEAVLQSLGLHRDATAPG